MLIDMHDYPPRAKAYWWLTVATGAIVLIGALQSSVQAGPVVAFEIIFGAAVAALAGTFAVRVPGTKTSSGAAEVVLFLLLLELGTDAAAIAAAAEAGAISWRTSKRWTSRLFSPAMAAAAMSACGRMFEWARSSLPIELEPHMQTGFRSHHRAWLAADHVQTTSNRHPTALPTPVMPAHAPRARCRRLRPSSG